MKNKIISIALVGSILAPIATTISCSSTQETTVRKKRNPYDFGEKLWGSNDLQENNIEIINDNKEINWSILEENGVDGLTRFFFTDGSELEDMAINSDMNIPKFIKVLKGRVFWRGIFNNKVVLHKELLENIFLNSGETKRTPDGFWKRTSGFFRSGFIGGTTLNGGYEIEEGTKYIPAGLFGSSSTQENLEEGVIVEMELPSSVEMIGEYAFAAFHKIETWDSKESLGEIPFSMDFSHLNNLTWIGEEAFLGDFSKELIKFPSSYTPGKSDGRINDSVPLTWGEEQEPVFSTRSKLPAHMFYSSPVEWTRSQKEILVGKSKVDEITWHNEWTE